MTFSSGCLMGDLLLWRCWQRWHFDPLFRLCSCTYSSSFSWRTSWLNLRTSSSSVFSVQTACLSDWSSCTTTLDAVFLASIASLSSFCRLALVSQRMAILRSRSLMSSACLLRSMRSELFSMEREPLMLLICSSLLLSASVSSFSTYLISTLCVRSSLPSYSDNASILIAQLAISRLNPLNCSSFVLSYLYKRRISSFLLLTCLYKSSILAVSVSCCLLMISEELCLVFSSVTYRSQPTTLLSSENIFASSDLMTSLRRVFSSCSDTSLLWLTSALMSLVVSVLFSRRVFSYLFLTSRQLCLSSRYS